MKDKITIALIIVGSLICLFVIMYGMRMFSSVSTPITVHEVSDGVRCATMVTGDGAAIDCWKFNQEDKK
jgi:hypothetical protein